VIRNLLYYFFILFYTYCLCLSSGNNLHIASANYYGYYWISGGIKYLIIVYNPDVFIVEHIYLLYYNDCGKSFWLKYNILSPGFCFDSLQWANLTVDLMSNFFPTVEPYFITFDLDSAHVTFYRLAWLIIAVVWQKWP